MIKIDIVKRVADQLKIKDKEALMVVDSIIDAMKSTIKEHGRMEVRNFGVFQVKETRPKPAARNPRTGQIIYVPARRKTHFRPGKLLKEELHKPIDDQPAPPQNVGYQPPPPSPNHSTPPQT